MSPVKAFVHNPENILSDQIMDNLDVMIWSLACPDLTPLYFNPATTRVYQRSCEELIEDDHLWLMAIAPDDQSKMQQAIAEAQETGSAQLNYRMHLSNGEIRHFSARLKIFKDASGIPIRLDAIANEICDPNQFQHIYTEEVFLPSEENYRQIVQQQSDMILRSRADTTITFANESLCRTLGSSLEQMIGKKWIDFADHDDLQSILHSLSSLSPEQSNFIAINRDRRANGEMGWTQWINQGLFNKKGELIGIQSTGRDVTALKQVEKALQQMNDELELRVDLRTIALQSSEAKFRGFFDFAPIGIAVANSKTYRFESVNKAFCQLLGYTESELLALSTCMTISVSEDLELERPYAEALMQGEINSYQIEKRYIKKNGEILIGSLTTTKLCDQKGNITHCIGMVQDITQRKVDEELLVRSDTHLKTAQRIGKLGSWEFDLQTGNVVWSEEVFRIFGRDPAIGTPTYAELQSSMHPDDWENFDHTVQNAIATAQSYDIEYRVYWADGTLVDILARGEIICDLMGKPIQIFGTVMDITDRKKTEQQLRSLTDRLSLAAKSAAIGIWEWDIAHNCLVWDERTYELYGVNPDPALDAYAAWASRVHHSDRELAEAAVQLALHGEKDYETEFRIVLPDGKIRYLKAYALVQRNAEGKPQCLTGINFDITDRKVAEAELNYSHDLREAIFNESTDALFLVDSQTFLTIDCNHLAVKLFEASDREQLIGIEGHTLQRHQFTKEEINAIGLDLESKGFWDREIEYISLQGRYFWGNLATKQITVAGKTINLVRVTDISDRKLAEAKILKTARQLENTNRELETFSYSVSHDLRAPLRHMNGFVNALQQRLKNHEALNDPKVIHYLQVIESSSQKMGGLIDGLLTLSRYGRRPLEATQISIRELVDEAIEIIRTDPHHNPIVEFAIGALPTAIGDRILLQQVFSNLISNAVKFSRKHPSPYIAIDSLPDQTIRIKDNGVGFQMEYADKLFGAFQRLHSEKEFEGTGIGLAIVQRIIQRHGGSIWAEGYPEQGATFFLKI
jgi:PAS domain S-box-containing protein